MVWAQIYANKNMNRKSNFSLLNPLLFCCQTNLFKFISGTSKINWKSKAKFRKGRKMNLGFKSKSKKEKKLTVEREGIEKEKASIMWESYTKCTIVKKWWSKAHLTFLICSPYP